MFTVSKLHFCHNSPSVDWKRAIKFLIRRERLFLVVPMTLRALLLIQKDVSPEHFKSLANVHGVVIDNTDLVGLFAGTLRTGAIRAGQETFVSAVDKVDISVASAIFAFFKSPIEVEKHSIICLYPFSRIRMMNSSLRLPGDSKVCSAYFTSPHQCQWPHCLLSQ